jgi:hypothetical protein
MEHQRDVGLLAADVHANPLGGVAPPRCERAVVISERRLVPA